ncbi:alpha/beta hydrolase [Nocardia altamirensis]|uniref:alpha/beta hydrolase n=1 Tax=Nocardia altamirensis TaxID=472158 RepID=UPI00083FDEBA|nr:alpha/beta hydrolase family protein [Nocardia altamirensis]
MSYEWPLDPEDLFVERYPQMLRSGLTTTDVREVRAAVVEMWPDAPGGWVYEWSKLAAHYAADGRHDRAAAAYGWAKFPCLADEAKREALDRQLAQYLLAAPGFGVEFERRILRLPYRDGTTAVPVHLFTPPELPDTAPVLLASGGVDTWKMDLHSLFVFFAMQTGVRLLAFDIPGTGESAVAMCADEGGQLVDGLIEVARKLGGGKVAHLGISMGGYYSARSGLSGAVDAALVLGGPVERAFTEDHRWRYGMSGIIGNALGFDAPPTDAARAEALHGFSLRPLLDKDDNAPMLVINGADDVHVPQHDTLVFSGRRSTEVALLPGTGHCATSELAQVVPRMTGWLSATLAS